MKGIVTGTGYPDSNPKPPGPQTTPSSHEGFGKREALRHKFARLFEMSSLYGQLRMSTQQCEGIRILGQVFQRIQKYKRQDLLVSILIRTFYIFAGPPPVSLQQKHCRPPVDSSKTNEPSISM